MGKKIDKPVKEKTPVLDDRHKTPEPYHCTGQFKVDFEELGKESGFYRTPPVLPRPKRPLSPNQSLLEVTTATASRRGKEDKKQVAQQQLKEQDEEQESQEDKELMDLFGFKPKTFLVKRTLDYQRPSIHVEQEHPDKHDTVLEVFIKGWKVDAEVLKNLSLCFPVMNKLHTINFWRVGFTSERITDLAVALSHCEHVKTLNIEANEPLEEENYYELIRDNSHLLKLRLRYCHISPTGAKFIGNQLGSVKISNNKLVALDLSSNKLGDEGAIHLAKGLRTNRSLLSLSLACNGISDVGCRALAEVISQFFLTKEEILERRQLLSVRNAVERAKSTGSPPTSRRGEGRPASVRSQERDRSKQARDKSSKAKKDGAKDEKPSAPAKGGKKDDKNTKKAATIADVGKGASKGGGKTPKGGRASKTISQLETTEVKPPSDGSEVNHPLLEPVEQLEGGRLLTSGNYMLIQLNLSRNKITDKGLEAMHKAMGVQRNHLDLLKVNGTGMMKVILKDNAFPNDSDRFLNFEEFMTNRDPYYKGTSEAQSKSPD